MGMSGGLKAREPRQKVMLPARMRVGSAYVDVCIRNISSRGMMLQAASPPPPGTYVEVLRAANNIVGRIVWAKDRRFGVHISDRVNVAIFVNQTVSATPRSADQERRSPDRPRAVSSGSVNLAQQTERSRRLSRAMEFGLLVGCGAVAAFLLAGIAYDVMAHPFQTIAAHLH